jgi:hypothetical protein
LADAKHEESFKVIDRRPFTAEGELRKEVVEQERREQESAEAARKTAAGSKTPSAAASAEAKGAPAVNAGTSPPAAAADAPAPSRSFQMLVDFLARNAAALLGGYTDPTTGQALLDLEGAREVIDMLDALHEKTHGNLAPDDDRLLLEVLGSLKLSFLEMTKAASQAMKEKVKSKS